MVEMIVSHRGDSPMKTARRMGSWGILAAAIAAMCWLTPVQAGEPEGKVEKPQMELPLEQPAAA